MTQIVSGRSGEIEGDSMQEFLDDEAQQWGESDLDEDAVMEGTEEEEGDQGEAGSVKPMATDAMMRQLEEIDPAMAANVRGMQRQMSTQENEFQGIKKDMLDTRERMLEYMEGGQGEDEEPVSDLPEGVTEDHLALFEGMAKHFGYVKQETVDQTEADRTANSYADAALHRAVETYGESFGSLGADGSVIVNPEVQARLDARLESLQDPQKGITALELYELEFGRPAATERSGEARPRPKRRANVMRRSTGSGPGNPDVKIYNPDRNEDSETVLDRAFVLAKREHL